MALPKEFRLRKRIDFEGFKKKGRIFSSNFIRLKISRRGDSGSKFAFAIPKRIGSAVKRNRIRRILSEWIRMNIEAFPQGHNWLLIVVGANHSEVKLSDALREDIAALSKRVRDEI